jgi:hypothetical protein
MAACATFKEWTRASLVQSLKAMKSDENRSWRRLPGSERIRAAIDLNLDLHALKGQAADASGPSD